MNPGSSPVAPLKSSLIQSLLNHNVYPHPVTKVEMLETHISWVLLTGDYAYKIKKPVDLGFLDFSRLEQRRFFCEEEIRLNRCWAPDLYLDVVAITNDEGKPRIAGTGPIVEYAVRMRQFAAGARLDEQLEVGLLTSADMQQVAVVVAKGHAAARKLSASDTKRFLEFTQQSMLENFDYLRGHFDYVSIQHLRHWTIAELKRLRPALRRRLAQGYVRECHGDLHLANIVRLADGITPFDCIEFSHDFRYIDVASDIAFLVMDLISRQRRDLAFAFLNRYLEVSGDYEGLEFFNLYFVYRCLVRAKVAAIRLQERAHDDPKVSEERATVRHYCDIASIQAADREAMLVLMHGLSASGKTHASGMLAETMPAVRVRSDVERKRLHGLAEKADSNSPIGQGIYTANATEEVYERLFALAETILAAKHDVVLDASFIDEKWRQRAMQVAVNCGAEFAIVTMVTPLEILRCRLLRRRAEKSDASEGSAAVLENQLQCADPLTLAEQELAVEWHSNCETDVELILAQLRRIKVQEMLPGSRAFSNAGCSRAVDHRPP